MNTTVAHKVLGTSIFIYSRVGHAITKHNAKKTTNLN